MRGRKPSLNWQKSKGQYTTTINGEFYRLGTDELPIHLRMTGCPHGCARPYTAELGIVGRTKSTYDLYVGGSVAGTRLGERLAVGIKLASLEAHLTHMLERHVAEALPGEGFGDFCSRLGSDKLASGLQGIRREPGRGDSDVEGSLDGTDSVAPSAAE